MISRNGVCYDLTKSSYKTTVNGLTFVFSSRLHLDKFKKKLVDHRETINASLTKRFSMDVNVTQLADVVLYKKIETRGFLIVTNEGNEIWLNNLTFVGGNVIPKKLNA